MTTPGRDFLLNDTLEFAVPLHMADVRHLPFRERYRLAAEAVTVVASQGDTLQYGSKATEFGDGAREMRKHRDHGTAKDETCGTCAEGKTAARCCLRRFRDRCGVCLRGQAQYSAGEVFNFLARGLAVLGCQPGGVTWRGLHWCAWPHPHCPNRRSFRKPPCCTCGDSCLAAAVEGGCRECSFCANGCRAAADQACCLNLPSSPAPSSPAPVQAADRG